MKKEWLMTFLKKNKKNTSYLPQRSQFVVHIRVKCHSSPATARKRKKETVNSVPKKKSKKIQKKTSYLPQRSPLANQYTTVNKKRKKKKKEKLNKTIKKKKKKKKKK